MTEQDYEDKEELFNSLEYRATIIREDILEVIDKIDVEPFQLQRLKLVAWYLEEIVRYEKVSNTEQQEEGVLPSGEVHNRWFHNV